MTTPEGGLNYNTGDEPERAEYAGASSSLPECSSAQPTYIHVPRSVLIPKRLFDIVFSVLGIAVLALPILIIGIIIMLDSKGGMFFRQKRVGRYGREFLIFKLRTMRKDADSIGNQLTLGNSDARITKIGGALRKLKFDELPQLINILIGDMSFVGPRPEVPRYVKLYTDEQWQVLSVRPGITGNASIMYCDESELLGAADDPESLYVDEILPKKAILGIEYIRNMSLLLDIKLLFKTFSCLFCRKAPRS